MLLRYQKLSPSEANNSVFVPLSGPICAVQSVHAVKEKVHRRVGSGGWQWLLGFPISGENGDF